MMRVLLYDGGYETFAVQYLLANLRQHGHEALLFFDNSFVVDYLAQDFPFQELFSLSCAQVAEDILAQRPQVVGFSMFTMFYQRYLGIIRALKARQPELMIIAGGFQPTLLGERVLASANQVDFILLGESELSLPPLLQALETHGRDGCLTLAAAALPGVWNRAPGEGGGLVQRGFSPIPQELDEIPFPVKELHYGYNPRLAQIYTVIASRGCPYVCTYCNSATMNKVYRGARARYYRVRSVDNVIAELRQAKERFRPRQVMFFDDVFAGQRDWLVEFAVKYRQEIDLPYYCQTSPLIHDADSVRLLAESGCVQLEFGFQSANAQVRKEVLARTETNDGMALLLREANGRGIFTELDLIANLPGETEAHLEESLEFIIATRPKWVNLSYLQFHPHTPITATAIQTGLLGSEDVERIQEGRHTTSMRLVAKSNLGRRHRVLPFQYFAAFVFPAGLARRTIRWLDRPLVGAIAARFASFFLYFSRILHSYLDRRDFLVRHHVVRSMTAMRWIVTRKVFGP